MGRPERPAGLARARRTFSPEFKQEALRLLRRRTTEG
jgi:transposase-like protein